jgi:hypothetical protein
MELRSLTPVLGGRDEKDGDMLAVVAITVLLATDGSTSGSKPPRLSPEAAELVRPVLSEFLAAHAEEFDGTGRYRGESAHSPVFRERLATLLSRKGPAADEAIAALLCFYVGEGPGEELMCEALKRGKRIVPYLQRFRRSPPLTGLEPIAPFFTNIPNMREQALKRIGAGERGEDCE